MPVESAGAVRVRHAEGCRWVKVIGAVSLTALRGAANSIIRTSRVWPQSPGVGVTEVR